MKPLGVRIEVFWTNWSPTLPCSSILWCFKSQQDPVCIRPRFISLFCMIWGTKYKLFSCMKTLPTGTTFIDSTCCLCAQLAQPVHPWGNLWKEYVCKEMGNLPWILTGKATAQISQDQTTGSGRRLVVDRAWTDCGHHLNMTSNVSLQQERLMVSWDALGKYYQQVQRDDPFPLYIQYCWGYTWRGGSSFHLPSTRDMDIMERVQWRATMIKGLEHQSYKQRPEG